MKNVVVPVAKRKPNKVDLLLWQVKNIRKNCKHDFRLLEKPHLVESLVKNVYVGDVQGPLNLKESVERTVNFSLVCLKCSEEKETSIYITCPRCFGNMRKGDIQSPFQIQGKWVWSRTRYFGTENLYHTIRLYRCPDCGFTVACDEWNQ